MEKKQKKNEVVPVRLEALDQVIGQKIVYGSGVFEQIEEANRNRKYSAMNDFEAAKKKLQDI